VSEGVLPCETCTGAAKRGRIRSSAGPPLWGKPTAKIVVEPPWRGAGGGHASDQGASAATYAEADFPLNRGAPHSASRLLTNGHWMQTQHEPRSLRARDLVEEIRRAMHAYSVTIAEREEADLDDEFGEVWVDFDDPGSC
jgi:hypothetical protein